MTNPVPEKLSNFMVYRSGENAMLGLADVELTNLENMTETTTGAGIAGEVENPVVGHFKALSLKLKWRTTTVNVTTLAAPVAHHLDLRGSIQEFDTAQGEFKHVPLKIVVKAIPKNTNLGKLETGKQMDKETEFSVPYLKLWHDSQERIEIDIYNFICIIHGVDYMARIRTNLGLGV